MDKKVTRYEAPEIVDYGDLQELTAGCLGGTGGDAFDPSGSAGPFTVGPSNPVGNCTSDP